MRKKILYIFGFLVLVYGVAFLVSPKVREKSNVLASAARQTTSRVINRVISPSPGRVSTLTASSCTYKEFSDLSSASDPTWGWAYWYLHSAKQNGMTSLTDSACSGGVINSNKSSQLIISNVCNMINAATGTSVSCPTGDGDSYSSWTRYLNAGKIKTEMIKRGLATNNPPTPAGSTAPTWSDTGCECQTEYCWTLGCEMWDCDSCEANGASTTGTCSVNSPDYTDGCTTQSHLASLLTYNINKNISYRIKGTINVANNSRPVTELAGTKLDLYESNDTGSRGALISTATVTYDGANQNYEMVFTKSMTDFLSKVPGKKFLLYVTPGDSKFYPDAQTFSINSVNTALNFSLLWKEDFSGQSFADVTPSHWAYWYITSMAQNKIMGGFSGNFYPDSQVTRARTALYSTLAKGAKPCCGAAGDPGTSSACQTCASVQVYNDLTTDNYFWGYGQSALLAGTMTGYNEPDGTRTFRPTENLIQQHAIWSMQKGGIANPQIPSGYNPGYSDMVPVTRAQLAALYAWNFNQNITIKIKGTITVKDNKLPATEIQASDIKLYKFAGHSQIDYASVAITAQDSTHLDYEMTLKAPVSWAVQNAIGQYFEVEIANAKIRPSDSAQFIINSLNIDNVNVEAVSQNIVNIHGEIYAGDATLCPSAKSSYSSTITVTYNGTNVYSPTVYKDGKITYSIALETSSEAAPISMTLAGTSTFHPVYTNFTLQVGENDREIWFAPMPKSITLTGRIIDAKTKNGIPYAYLKFRDKWIDADENGYWKNVFNTNADNPSTAEDEGDGPGTYYVDVYGGGKYNERIDAPLEINSCPGNQFFNYELDSNPICSTISGNKICWYGKEAKNWKNNTDPAYATLWNDLSVRLNQVQAKGLGLRAKGINIISGADNGWANDYLDGYFGGWINLGTIDLAKNGAPQNTQEAEGTISHEYGHLFYKFKSAQIGIGTWRTIYSDGTKLYKGSSPDIWYWATDSSWARSGGHPYDDTTELFASTFFIMDGNRAEFETLVKNKGGARPLNDEAQQWYIRLYNQHASTWPTGDPDGKYTAMIREVIGYFKR